MIVRKQCLKDTVGRCTYELTQLWQHAQDLHTQNLSIEEGGGRKIAPLAESWQQIADRKEEKLVFFKTIDPDKKTMLQQKAMHPRRFGQDKLGLMGLKK